MAIPDDSSVHSPCKRWEHNGVLDRIWAALVEKCEELGGVDWQCGDRIAPPPGKVQMLQWRSSRFGGDAIGPIQLSERSPEPNGVYATVADGGPLAGVWSKPIGKGQ